MSGLSFDFSWFAPEGTPLRVEIYRLTELRQKLGERTKAPHTYVSLLNHQYYREAEHGLVRIKNGVTTAERSDVSPRLAKSHIYLLCSVPAFYQHILTRADLAIASLVDALFSALAAGKLLPACLCMRAIIEHAAQSSAILGAEVLKVSEQSDAKIASEQIVAAKLFLDKAAYPTRVGWREILFGDTPIRSQANIKYSPEANRVDHTAKSILSYIDKLDRRVTGVRNIYEVLCEFAHPNFGAQFAFNEKSSDKLEVDDSGTAWKSFTIGSGFPVAAARDLASVHAQTVGCVSDCIQDVIDAGESARITHQRLESAVKVVVRAWTKKYSPLFSPYENCPCRSGKKLKFCCGLKV